MNLLFVRINIFLIHDNIVCADFGDGRFLAVAKTHRVLRQVVVTTAIDADVTHAVTELASVAAGADSGSTCVILAAA